MTTWFITGCSTGLGRSLAEAVLARGDNAVVSARTIDNVHDIAQKYPETSLAVALDVTDANQVLTAASAAEKRFGGIDVLVNNAGYGYRAAIEEGDVADVEKLFATNFFGAIAMIKAVLPSMRVRRSGAIVNISSIGARISPVGSGYYAASKSALESISFSLGKELAPLGISVTVIEPGGFRTDFAGRSLEQAATPIADYADTAGRRRKEFDTTHGTQQGDPDRAAQVIIEAATSPNPPSILLLGSDSFDAFGEALRSLLAETDARAEQSRSTDFPQ